jgi:PST family polysaccharide transporter
VFAGLSRLTNDARAFEATLVDAMRLMVHMNAAWAGVLMPCAALVVRTVFGEKWMPAAPLVAIFAGYGAVAAAGMVPPQAYRAIGRPRINVTFLAAQLCVVVPAFVFVARRGPLPLAGFQLIQGSVFSIVNVILCSRILPLPLAAIGSAIVAPLTIGAALAIWNFALIRMVALDPPALQLLIQLITSGIFWGTLLYAFDRHGWTIFRQLLTRTR